MRFGYGAGADCPLTWLDPFQITRTSVQKLEPGIAFVLHWIPPGWYSIPRATYEHMSRAAG